MMAVLLGIVSQVCGLIVLIAVFVIAFADLARNHDDGWLR